MRLRFVVVSTPSAFALASLFSFHVASQELEAEVSVAGDASGGHADSSAAADSNATSGGKTASDSPATPGSVVASDSVAVSESGASSIPAYAGARADRHPDPYAPGPRFGSAPYIQRYAPTGNLWEVGLYMGMFFPSAQHNLKVPSLPHEPYSSPNFVLGGRLAYFPLSFLGIEAEGMASMGSTEETDRSAVFYGARGQGVLQLPLYSVVPFVVVGGGVLGAVSEPMGHDGDPVFHFGGGVKVPFNHLVSARLDLRDSIGQKYLAEEGTSAHHVELLLGATFTFERKPPAPPKDSDYDGLFDDEDSCPNEGALTSDGCPMDGDGDGVFDRDDECPREAGDAPTGCPNLDEDGDGVPVPADQCPGEPGEAPSGCPVKDLDGDGIIAGDKCPTEAETRNGFEDDDGCPDEVPEEVKRFTGIIRGINFKQGTADIDKASYDTLDGQLEVLKKYPSIRIEISGHTSSEGRAARNQELSVQRANAVRDYFVEKEVAEDRVIARGAGASEPIADNETLEGRQQNRRIEIRILSQR